MSTSAVVELVEPRVTDVWFENDMLRVRLADGREIGTPCEWFPRLRDATGPARTTWRLIGGGIGIHWPDLDEDISVETLLRLR